MCALLIHNFTINLEFLEDIIIKPHSFGGIAFFISLLTKSMFHIKMKLTIVKDASKASSSRTLLHILFPTSIIIITISPLVHAWTLFLTKCPLALVFVTCVVEHGAFARVVTLMVFALIFVLFWLTVNRYQLNVDSSALEMIIYPIALVTMTVFVFHYSKTIFHPFLPWTFILPMRRQLDSLTWTITKFIISLVSVFLYVKILTRLRILEFLESQLLAFAMFMVIFKLSYVSNSFDR